MRKTIFATIVFVLISTAVVNAAGRIITVDDDGPADFDTIQAAIDVAADGDTVLIKDGTYTGPGNRDIDFLGKAISVKSENGPNNCLIDCENSGRAFVFQNNEEPNSVASGLTIKNGEVRGGPVKGGAIYCIGASPTIENCIITNNSVRAVSGGGSYGPDAYGGGIYSDYSSNPTITNCKIIGNVAYGGLGGISTVVGGGGPQCMGLYFVGLDGGRGYGGGIYCQGTAIINNCLLADNIAAGGAGGGHNSLCSEKGDDGDAKGGAIYTNTGTTIKTTVNNCTIVNNIADGASSYGDGIRGIATVTNCIIWSNGDDLSLCDTTYSCIEDFDAGTGNIHSDPCFVNPGYWDSNGTPSDSNDDFWVESVYHLLEDSPCINTGDPNYVGVPGETDLDGNPRITGKQIDMGAYEFIYILITKPEESIYLACTGYEVVWQKRLSRSEFEYCLRMKIKNLGSSDLEDITVELKSVSANTVVLNDKVFFSSIPVGGEVLSEDTFIIRVNRTIAANENDIIWEISDEMEGDFSGDGQVNFVDFGYLAGKWLQTGAGMAEDLYKNEVIDFDDLAMFIENWLRD